MNYVDFETGGKAYKLRLNTRNIAALEKQLGYNIAFIFGMDEKDIKVPTVGEMVAFLHASLQQLNHGITQNDAYDIFDSYLADGNTPFDFMGVINEVFFASGIFRKEESGTEKNA